MDTIAKAGRPPLTRKKVSASIALDSGLLARLDDAARTRYVSRTSLVASWLAERLDLEERKP